MKATIYLGCLVVIIGTLAWSASAQQNFHDATPNSVAGTKAGQIQLKPEEPFVEKRFKPKFCIACAQRKS